MYLIKMQLNHGISFAGENNSAASLGIIHSDTLFSALINQLALVSQEDLASFDFKNPPFRISSAFPYFYDTFYLPKPIGTSSLFMTTLKGYSFLPLSYFLALAQGEVKKNIQHQELADSRHLFYSYRIPRVSVDRITAVARPYWPNVWYTKEGSGLYFLIDIIDDSFFPRFTALIRLLGESGLGSDRSVGQGQFTPEITTIDETSEWHTLFTSQKDQDSLYYSLSLCWPPDHSQAKTAFYYKLLTRKGWIFSTSTYTQMKRRECKMFAEGSLFHSPITGGIADVTPGHFTDHPVYRYGLGMMVPLKRSGIVDET